MNIFFLDPDPVTCARYHCDKHVVKMVLETAQILCTALYCKGFKDLPYKPTHMNHPCTVWARETEGNFRWLVELGLALSEEYRRRYGKTHKSQHVIELCGRITSDYDDKHLTPPAQAMPDEYRHSSPMLAYRRYYMNDKAHIATWKYTKPPVWWQPK